METITKYPRILNFVVIDSKQKRFSWTESQKYSLPLNETHWETGTFRGGCTLLNLCRCVEHIPLQVPILCGVMREWYETLRSVHFCPRLSKIRTDKRCLCSYFQDSKLGPGFDQLDVCEHVKKHGALETLPKKTKTNLRERKYILRFDDAWAEPNAQSRACWFNAQTDCLVQLANGSPVLFATDVILTDSYFCLYFDGSMS